MKKSFLLFLTSVFTLVSCEFLDHSLIWDKLNDHENRIDALEEWCKQINTNIAALQTIIEALQNNDYVTSVTPITENGITIGYSLTFSKSGSVSIFNGRDGADGVNGENGSTPIIGIMQDSDGIHYWTVDGNWLLDENGNKVKAVGTDGQDGQDGQNGAAGKDSVTPQLKIEEDIWYVSYDNCATWIELGQATGEQGPQGPQGPQGTPGQSGDSFFQSVSQDENNVYLTMSDGSVISIPRTLPDAVTISLQDVTANSAIFSGIVNRNTPDLKVTVYYGLNSNISVYKNTGSKSITDFGTGTFTLSLSGLNSNTRYYYFTEIVSNGVNTYSQVASFTTDADNFDEGVDMNPEIGNM